MREKKERLRNLIICLLNKFGETPKVKLAKLILFTEIERFKETGNSITGLYFVRFKRGPVIAFFDDILEEGLEKHWDRKTKQIEIFEEGRMKNQYSFFSKINGEFQTIADTINEVYRKYKDKSGTELSLLSHSLPAWKYSEPNEPIYIAELAVENEEEYFALTDLIEDIDDDEHILAEKVSQALHST